MPNTVDPGNYSIRLMRNAEQCIYDLCFTRARQPMKHGQMSAKKISPWWKVCLPKTIKGREILIFDPGCQNKGWFIFNRAS